MFYGKKKAITFSYDDGVIQDRRLIELLDKYQLKATFNLNSGCFGTTFMLRYDGGELAHTKVEASEVRELYKNHEVAAHTLTHPSLPTLSDEEVIRQVEEDRVNLSKIVGYDVVGMAYPGGGINNDERVQKLIKAHTGVKYCRTIDDTYAFDVEQDLYRYCPSVFHFAENGKTYELCKQFVEMETDKPQVLYIWGHSYEMEIGDRWGELEDIFRLISGRDDIFYGTNREIFECCGYL